MRRAGWVRRVRAAAGALAVGLLAVAVLTPASPAGSAASQPYVRLQGAGAWSLTRQLVPWQNELSSAKSPIDLNYVRHGSLLGREDLSTGHVDFAISGVPFPAAEQGKFIAAPVQVATLATYVHSPRAGFTSITVRCDPDDETTWPPDVVDFSQCIVRTPYNGPTRIPNRNLAAMFLHYVGGEELPLLAWNHPDQLAAMGVPQIDTFNRGAGPGVAGRSDPDEINFYLQSFVKIAAPDVWQGVQAVNPQIPWEPITERLGQVSGVTRDGAEQQVTQLPLGGGCGVLGDCGAASVAGGVAHAPPSLFAPLKAAFPNAFLSLAEMRNANGDWVGPTPDAINAAVEAGGASPLYALTNPAPGAYPLVWVDSLYAPRAGLSAQKTEGIATLIRYLATTGQAQSAAIGEGVLSQSLVDAALAAANEVVVSNCKGSDRRLYSSTDPGPLAPPSAAEMRTIGDMQHCEALAAAPTTTLPGSTPTVPFDPTDFGSSPIASFDDTVSPTAVGVGDSDAVAPSDAPANTKKAAAKKEGDAPPTLLVASTLPLPVSSGPSGADRVATFLVGVGLFLLLRKPVGRLVHRLAS